MHIVANFRVGCKAEMDEKLDSAVAAARREAFVDRTLGVLVTRHDFGQFSVALSPAVPFGLIREPDHVCRN